MSTIGLLQTTQEQLTTAEERVKELEKAVQSMTIECSTGLCSFEMMSKHRSLARVQDICETMGFGILGERLNKNGETK